MNNKITWDEPIYPDPMRGTEQSLLNQYPDALPIGLTKREHFAALAMQGMCANRWISEQGVFSDEAIAKAAVNQADALILELNKPHSND